MNTKIEANDVKTIPQAISLVLRFIVINLITMNEAKQYYFVVLVSSTIPGALMRPRSQVAPKLSSLVCISG